MGRDGKSSVRDFLNSGQIRENFFHIVSYFLGFFCMVDSSFSTSRKARGPYYRILTQTEIRTLLRSQLCCWWHKVWQSCRKWSGRIRGNIKYISRYLKRSICVIFWYIWFTYSTYLCMLIKSKMAVFCANSFGLLSFSMTF